MADSTINGLTALAGADVDNTADQLAIWDNSANTTKKITRTEVLTGIPAGTAAAPAITPTGDSNTGVWFSAADQITLVTGGQPRLSVSDVGQLLINRTGSIGVPSFASSSDGNTGFYFPAADNFGLVTGGVERVRVDSAGRVGIGTASPSSFNPLATPSLAIVGASSNVGIGNLNVWSNDTGGAADLGGNIALGGDDGVTVARTYAEIRGRKENATSGNYASYLSFATRANLGSITERMRIDSAGQVGIGKTPSLGLLDVNGDAYFNTVRVGLGGGAVSTNMAVGNNAMAATATGTGNVAVGQNSMAAMTSGSDNTAIGRGTLQSTTTGSNNTALGRQALNVNTASDNTAVGYAALSANTSGTDNTAVGRGTLSTVTTSSGNTAVGRSALFANTAADNTAVGASVLTANTSGTNNVGVGKSALFANTSGSRNTAIGAIAGDAAISVNDNTSVGYAALTSCVSGNQNTAVGSLALQNGTGSTNTAVGYAALGSGSTAAGSGNVAVGSSAGDVITTGSDNTLIGQGTDPSANNGTGQIVLGKGVTGQGDNTITVGINTTWAKLPLDGTTTSWTASSDERLKKDIADYSAGLDVVTALRPVTYKWKSRSEVPEELTNYHSDSDEPVCGTAGKTYHGFIAQEVKAVIDAHSEIPDGQNLWGTSYDGVQTLAPSDLIPILVNAIKQLTARVQSLENK